MQPPAVPVYNLTNVCFKTYSTHPFPTAPTSPDLQVALQHGIIIPQQLILLVQQCSLLCGQFWCYDRHWGTRLIPCNALKVMLVNICP